RRGPANARMSTKRRAATTWGRRVARGGVGDFCFVDLYEVNADLDLFAETIFMPTLEAILERITYHSEQDGYMVARVQPRGKDYLVTIVGKLLGVQVGESLELEGRWVDHPEHGRQFEVERFRTVLPATVEGIRRYLGSGLIKGAGPVMARRITETLGARTLHAIRPEPLGPP